MTDPQPEPQPESQPVESQPGEARPEPPWQRLDPRMLLAYPIQELVRFLPALVALFLAGSVSDQVEWWQLAAVAAPIALGLLRYLTTSYRITPERVELRRGLVSRHLLSTPRDRVRAVDLTASLPQRLLGLTTARVGTGTASTDEDDHLDLEGLPLARARQLRAALLDSAAGTGPAQRHPSPGQEQPGQEQPGQPAADRVVLRLAPSWVRFAPLTTSGLVVAGGLLGAGTQLFESVGREIRVEVDADSLREPLLAWSWWLLVPLALAALLALVSALAIAGYLVSNWGFTLTRAASGAWQVRRGLFTTRETTVDAERVSGVAVSEPIGLRLAHGGSAAAIVTGLSRTETGSVHLSPPAPRAVVGAVAAEVLGTAHPLTAPLTGHGPRARTRRYVRALGPAVLLTACVVALVALVEGTPVWLLAPAVLACPAALLLARDRTRSLGHALVAGHVVARSGSLERRREVLAVPDVIGWNLRETWFQRRAGLTTLIATTAGGPQRVTFLDIPEQEAVTFAHAATPALLAQFLRPDVSSDADAVPQREAAL